MEVTHLYALLPLLALLILSLVFYGRGLIHITTFSYCLCLAFVAITNNWELMFFPIIVGTGVITILLFVFAMTRGDWL